MNLREKLQEHIAEQNTKNHDNFDHALFRAGAIVVAGYLFGTLIAWFILR